MRSGADLRSASPLVIFNHVIDPHFVAFSSSLYTTIWNPKPNPNLNSNPDPDPNPNHTVNTDPQIGPIDPQIVTVQIRPADPPRSEFCRVPVPTYAIDVNFSGIGGLGEFGEFRKTPNIVYFWHKSSTYA